MGLHEILCVIRSKATILVTRAIKYMPKSPLMEDLLNQEHINALPPVVSRQFVSIMRMSGQVLVTNIYAFK